jgi:hypothetical protein
MARRPMTAGELNSLQRVTPTGYAEEAYQAKLKQNRPMPRGPSGLPVPAASAIFRPTADPAILKQLLKAAGAAYEATQLSEEANARFRLAITDELKRIWPPADMLVLERYGFARPVKSATVLLNTTDPGEKPVYVDLPTAVLMPEQGHALGCELGGRYPTKVPSVPAAAVDHCRSIARTRSQCRHLAQEAQRFPGQFKVRTGRWPRWIEIEREFPPLGTFLAAERQALARTKGKAA